MCNTEKTLSFTVFFFLLQNRSMIFKLFRFVDSPGHQCSIIKTMKEMRHYKYLILIFNFYFSSKLSSILRFQGFGNVWLCLPLKREPKSNIHSVFFALRLVILPKHRTEHFFSFVTFTTAFRFCQFKPLKPIHLHITSAHQSAHFIILFLRKDQNNHRKSPRTSCRTDSYWMNKCLL